MGFGDQWSPPRMKRAALVVEFEDGIRMLYAMESPITMEIEADMDTVADLSTHVLSSYSSRNFLTVSGPFMGGRIWKDRMPGEDQDEIEPRRQEIEQA